MKLGLGTVQFGIDYGISNTCGQVPIAEVKKILALAQQSNITILDTSAGYGKSEAILGQTLLSSEHFQIVTKTPTFAQQTTLDAEHGKIITSALLQSLELLRCSSIYGLLMHHAEDLLKPGGEYLMEAMLACQHAGQVQRIGVSVYNGNQIDKLLQRYPDLLQIIQVPINVFDQRLISSHHLIKLKQKSIEIHARSVFLQGLLLMPCAEIPEFFAPIKAHIQNYLQTIRAEKLSPLEAALLFIKQIDFIDTILVGVTSTKQLLEIIDAYHRVTNRVVDFSFAAVQNECLINPSLWRVSP